MHAAVTGREGVVDHDGAECVVIQVAETLGIAAEAEHTDALGSPRQHLLRLQLIGHDLEHGGYLLMLVILRTKRSIMPANLRPLDQQTCSRHQFCVRVTVTTMDTALVLLNGPIGAMRFSSVVPLSMPNSYQLMLASVVPNVVMQVTTAPALVGVAS